MAEHDLSYKDRGSVLNRVYPLVKLVWVFLIAVGLFLFTRPLSGMVVFLFVLFLALIPGKMRPGEILKSGLIVFGLGFLLMIFHFLIDPGETVWSFGFLQVSDYGLQQGPVFFFRLSGVVLASFILIWTTDTRDLMQSLVKAGMPYRYAYTIFLALRFLPLIQREVESVKAAHAIRGRAAGTTLKHRIILWQRYVFTILINGLRKAENTADALECRAFGYAPERTYVKRIAFRKRDMVLILFTLLLEAGLIAGERLF
ncbi:MAG: energy-coupling factor transporter transmembrane protein EcfT [Spirochaetales bacterium]|nr:energy-coupling factor transporter transmembrane protein EcfT [Spirochaetales bacterium]